MTTKLDFSYMIAEYGFANILHQLIDETKDYQERYLKRLNLDLRVALLNYEDRNRDEEIIDKLKELDL